MNSYLIIGRRDLTVDTAMSSHYRFWQGARLDRLRVYRTLSDAEILQLTRQDIDRDGLHDRTEARHRLWQNRNKNGIRNSDESFYIMRPFQHDPLGVDHDNDGINSHDEQNLPAPNSTFYSDPANYDTDGDLLPDGWEKQRNFSYANPNAPSNKDLDPDTDGLTNYAEYLAGTNPVVDDTDGDGVDDGPEVTGGSNPNQGGDQGQAPDPNLTYSLKLGVGDESGSNSEMYEMVIYTYDWQTKTEQEVTRISPQSYGDYVERTLPGLDPLETYTFQIQWKGTKLDTYNGAGPDLDYTFKVEPLDSNSTVTVSEVFNPSTSTFEQGGILGKHNNVNDFHNIVAPKRVVAENIVIDLAMDYDMNRKIETLFIPLNQSIAGLPSTRGPDLSKQDRTLFQSDPQRYCIIDINNNNTDYSGSGGTTGQVDNSNNILDTEADRIEMTNDAEGHSFGILRLWAVPNMGYGMWWKGGSYNYEIKLSLEDPENAQNVIRVFDWTSFDKDKGKPKVLLGPGKTSHTFDPAEFFDPETFKTTEKAKWFHRFCVEGISYGKATIKLEVIDVKSAERTVKFTQTARVAVNVDQYAQAQAQIATNRHAITLRGVHPHYFGASNPNACGSEGIRAFRGNFRSRVPSIKIGGVEHAQITPMNSRVLRTLTPSSNSTASFWMGIQSEVGGQLQWAQCGLVWQQPQQSENPGGIQAYLETGLSLGTADGVYTVRRYAIPTGDDPTLDSLAVTNQSALQGWHSGMLDLSYIAYKKPVTRNAGGDISAVPWILMIRDNRPSATLTGKYIRLECGVPVPPNTPPSAQTPYIDAYKDQSMRRLDVMFESNQSIAFGPGREEGDQKGEIKNIQVASGLIPNASLQPAETQLEDLWLWLNANVLWQNIQQANAQGAMFNDITEIRDGTNENGKAKAGSRPHPFWQKSIEGAGIKVWDIRNYGYGANTNNQ